MTRSMGALLLGLVVAACGGRTDRLEGLAGPTEGTSCDANPDGDCYPTTDLGTNAMQLDAKGDLVTRGDRIADFRFLGFRSPGTEAVDDVAADPQRIALSDYYDPDGARGIKLLVIMVNVRWCEPSNEEADFVSGANYTGQNTGDAAFARELEPLGVRFFEVLTNGPTVGSPATFTDLRAWITSHEVDYTAVVGSESGDQTRDDFDVGGSLGVFFTNAAIPFNMVIDARSMEILSSGTGFDTAFDVRLKNWLTWQDAHAPL